MRVRCEQCNKKISIDEAFAGGMCRCPYCGAITKAGDRPLAVAAMAARPERPGMPAPSAPAAEEPAEAPEVPLARPVRIQGITAMVMLALLIAMIAFVVIFYYSVIRQLETNDQPPRPTGPPPPTLQERTGADLAKLAPATPVVYVVDGGSSMSEFYDTASVVVRLNVRDLATTDKFNILIAREAEGLQLTDGWAAGGSGAGARVDELLDSHAPVGATDLAAAVRRAIGLSPKTVVVLAAKSPGDPAELDKLAKSAGCVISGVSLGGYPDVEAVMKDIAARTGGHWIALTSDQLVDYLDHAPPLP